MATLTDFIQTYDDSLSEKDCQFLIDLFEQNPEYQNSVVVDKTVYYTELDLTKISQLSSEVKEIHNNLIRKVFTHRDDYYEVFNRNVFPEKHAFERFKIRKYESIEGEGSYTNVEVIDYETARRYLSFFWFLNDNDGGQLEFLDLLVNPKCGQLLIFPPLWMFPYKEHSSANVPKYVLTTYLHYK